MDLCFASPVEIPEWQHPRRATGNCRNLQCEDDSILRANVTWELGPLLGVVGSRSGGLVLLAVSFSCVGKYIALLISSLGMSGAAPSTWLRMALNLRRSCSWLGEYKGSWMVGYLCSCPGCAVTRHREQYYDLWHFRVFRRKPCTLPPIGGNF